MIINNKLAIIIITFFLVSQGFGQSQKSFEKLIAKTNIYLEKYAQLSPFNHDRHIPYHQSGLPNNIISQIKKDYLTYDGYAKDSISEFNLLLEFQGLIIENITQIISHKNFNKNKVEELIHKDRDLSIAVSDDRKLINFSLDEKTGGTYRSRISLTHYIDDTTTLQHYI